MTVVMPGGRHPVWGRMDIAVDVVWLVGAMYVASAVMGATGHQWFAQVFVVAAGCAAGVALWGVWWNWNWRSDARDRHTAVQPDPQVRHAYDHRRSRARARRGPATR